jgi:hypothetical protein
MVFDEIRLVDRLIADDSGSQLSVCSTAAVTARRCCSPTPMSNWTMKNYGNLVFE